MSSVGWHESWFLPRTYCRVCRWVLDAREDAAGNLVAWQHPLSARQAPNWVAHTPDPVSARDLTDDEVRVCDFCAQSGPSWEYPALPFEMELTAVERVMSDGWGSAGSWAACEECHRLIEVGQWRQLANRCLDEGSERPLPRELRRWVRTRVLALHQCFVAHRCGPARRMTV